MPPKKKATPRPAAQQPVPGPTRSQRIAVFLLLLVAVATFGVAVYLMASGNAQSGIAELIVPIAAVVASRLVPRGWRGGPR